MTVSARTNALLLLLLLLPVFTACGPSKQPPAVDPLKEQLTVLQKQLLELQKVQLDTRKKVDEQAANQASINDSLSGRVKVLEDHKNAPPPPPAVVKPTSTAPAAPVKKPAKKPVKKKKKPAAQSPQ